MTLRVAECTLSKGTIEVTIYVTDIEDRINNKLFVITPPTGSQNQDQGPQDNMIVDLLRLSRTFVVKGVIINNTDKSNLITLIKGANTKGGAITFTYPDGGTAASFDVYCETCSISQRATDEPDAGSVPTDFAKFDVALTLIEGKAIGVS